MSYHSIITLVEEALQANINAQSFVTSRSITVTDSFVGQLVDVPCVVVKCESTSEQPEQSGNFVASVEILMVGAMDPDNADTYEQNISSHRTNAGHIHRYITDTLTAAGLEAAVPSGSNGLTVYDVRLVGSGREINTADGVLEDSFNLEIYAKES